MSTRGYPSAIVRPQAANKAFAVGRRPPSPALAGHVDYYWHVAWDLADGDSHDQQIIPQPRIHIAAEHGRLLVHGVARKPFVRHLTGRGHTLGVSFLPAMFRPLLGRPVSSIADEVHPASELLGPDDAPTARTILATDDDAEMVAAMESYLLELDPVPDDQAEEVRRLVSLAEDDRAIVRAAQLAEAAGTSLRTLERLFGDYVGIGPKWVIQRFRVLEVAARAHAGVVDWAATAAELGFSDQAHLVRAFRDVVGSPPGRYARSL